MFNGDVVKLLLGHDIAGVRFNVVRRPLSGGVGSIRPHKATKNKPAETPEEFQARLGAVIREQPEAFFTRFQSEVGPTDVSRFRRECLDPILEAVCDWYEQQTMTQVTYCGMVSTRAATGYVPVTHWRHPFGCVSAVDEYGWGDVDEFLATGSTVGLDRRDTLFEELR